MLLNFHFCFSYSASFSGILEPNWRRIQGMFSCSSNLAME